MRDIALMGYARSGKDTAGRHLVERHGYARVSFADPVRESLLALDPVVLVPGRHIFGYPVDPAYRRLSDVVDARGWERAKDSVPEVRRLLQAHGTEAVRGVIGDDTWVRIAQRKILDARYGRLDVVVTDCRFPNEARELRAMGFRLVWLDRPGVGPANGHASDNALGPEDADVVLANDGTEADLATLLDTIL